MADDKSTTATADDNSADTTASKDTKPTEDGSKADTKVEVTEKTVEVTTDAKKESECRSSIFTDWIKSIRSTWDSFCKSTKDRTGKWWSDIKSFFSSSSNKDTKSEDTKATPDTAASKGDTATEASKADTDASKADTAAASTKAEDTKTEAASTDAGGEKDKDKDKDKDK